MDGGKEVNAAAASSPTSPKGQISPTPETQTSSSPKEQTSPTPKTQTASSTRKQTSPTSKTQTSPKARSGTKPSKSKGTAAKKEPKTEDELKLEAAQARAYAIKHNPEGIRLVGAVSVFGNAKLLCGYLNFVNTKALVSAHRRNETFKRGVETKS